MNKQTYIGLQITGMVLTVIGAQAAIRTLFDHHNSPLWGALDWTPGGWVGRLVALAVIICAAVLLAGWAHDKAEPGR
ncbi:hypothetical protein [Nocardia sp. NPDC004722]